LVFEIAEIEVLENKGQDFEQGVTLALPLFQRARGCGGATLRRSIENPLNYTLVVRWDTVEDHMVHFRQSEDYQKWRGLVGNFFAKPPQVHHAQVVVG
jgi:heme-degrading monooxygenase HmoA